ncbi:MAG TPA: response regulator [Nitrospiria bacterium]|nr:response regulator [Nitrospiria bacterium]
MPKKILIVDDADTILLMEKVILSKGSYKVVTAKDGEEAIKKAGLEKPDLILLDVMMPKMNGFDTCKYLRTRADMENTPIILVTTRGEAENMEKGYESGCTDYITKPINGAELLSKVKNYLGE